MNNVIDFIHVNRERYLEELKALLAIPSISALPEHAGDVRRCAEWCADEMRRIGLQNVQLFETPGNPVVYADWLGAEPNDGCESRLVGPVASRAPHPTTTSIVSREKTIRDILGSVQG